MIIMQAFNNKVKAISSNNKVRNGVAMGNKANSIKGLVRMTVGNKGVVNSSSRARVLSLNNRHSHHRYRHHRHSRHRRSRHHRRRPNSCNRDQ